MNNLTFGDAFGYYETIGGGCGARPTWDGTSSMSHDKHKDDKHVACSFIAVLSFDKHATCS